MKRSVLLGRNTIKAARSDRIGDIKRPFSSTIIPRQNNNNGNGSSNAGSDNSSFGMDINYNNNAVRKSNDNRDFILSILQTSSTKRDAKTFLKRYAETTKKEDDRLVAQQQAQDAEGLETAAAGMEVLRAILNPEIKMQKTEKNRRYVQRLLQQNQPSYLRFAGLQDNEMDEWLPPLLGEDQVHVAIVKIRDAHLLSDDTMNGIGKTLAQLHKLGLTACVVLDADIDAEATFPENYRRAEIQAERVQNAVVNANAEARIVGGSVWRNLKEIGQTSIGIPNLLLAPLGRQVIPIITAFGYTKEQKCVPVSANGIVMALSRLFTDPTRSTTTPKDGKDEDGTPVILDRIIFLDHLGGTPSVSRGGNPHVYVNLRQEYSAITEELTSQPRTPEMAIHMENLSTINYCLELLNDEEASALITSPSEAAFHVRDRNGSLITGEPETKNPLLHNFLTNRPIISSSLPIRLDGSRKPKTTLLKLGMPLEIITCPKLSDPQVDLEKLEFLINDSFGRELDTTEYLKRVDGNLAALIVAGDYDGAAIITWEYPEYVDEHGNKTLGERVPYLDKFAVCRKSQGGGLAVADVLFKAMVMGLFPKGVVWRSRRNNPVNKWYFERSNGSIFLPGGHWTMFWTFPNDVFQQKCADLTNVCSKIEPTWKN